MIDRVEYLEVDGVKYPYFCGFNVLEEIQNRYSSIDNWDKKIRGKSDDGNDEINVSDLKITLTLMLNEGAEIKGEELFTEKQVGRLISMYGLQKATAIVQSQVSISIHGKNEQTTQEQKITEKIAK